MGMLVLLCRVFSEYSENNSSNSGKVRFNRVGFLHYYVLPQKSSTIMYAPDGTFVLENADIDEIPISRS